MSDQNILEFIRAGKDNAALNRLYRYYPTVQKMIVANGGSRADAEDIFQEALIICIKKFRTPGFQLIAGLNTYLFSVCRLLWMDELKKRKKQAFVEFGPQAGIELADIEADILGETQARVAEQVLVKLKDRCRQLLLLFYQGRMKLKDIARKMGYSSENTARNQKYKCLEAARDQVKEWQKNNPEF